MKETQRTRPRAVHSIEDQVMTTTQEMTMRDWASSSDIATTQRVHYTEEIDSVAKASCFPSFFPLRLRAKPKTMCAGTPESTMREPANSTETPVSHFLSTSAPGARCILCGAGKYAVNEKTADCELCGTQKRRTMHM